MNIAKSVIGFISQLLPVTPNKLRLHELSRLKERLKKLENDLKKTEDELASYKGLYEQG